eukprot:403346812
MQQQSPNIEQMLFQNIMNESALKEKFRRETVIGKGAFGKVYKVTKLQTYAMKEFNQNLSDFLPDDLIELKIMTDVKSKYLCQVIDSFISTNKKKLCIVSEYARHGNLEEYCERKFKEKIPEDLAKQWLAQTALGLKELHSRNIIHRDIKPQNILVFKKDNIKIADYGLAKIVNENQPLNQSVVGTMQYMSIEMKQKDPYSFSTDIFSLGVTFIHLLTQKFPYFNSNGENSIPKMSGYSKKFTQMIKSMIDVKQENRPTVDDILRSPLIANTKAIQEFWQFFSIRNSLDKVQHSPYQQNLGTARFYQNSGQHQRQSINANQLSTILDESLTTQQLQSSGITPKKTISVKKPKNFQTINLKQIYSPKTQQNQLIKNQVKPAQSTNKKRASSKIQSKTTRPISTGPTHKRANSREIASPQMLQSMFKIDNRQVQDVSAQRFRQTPSNMEEFKNDVASPTQTTYHSPTQTTQATTHDFMRQKYEAPLETIQNLFRDYLEIRKEIEKHFIHPNNHLKQLLSEPNNIQHVREYQATINQVKEVVLANMTQDHIFTEEIDRFNHQEDDNINTQHTSENFQDAHNFKESNSSQGTQVLPGFSNNETYINYPHQSNIQDSNQFIRDAHFPERMININIEPHYVQYGKQEFMDNRRENYNRRTSSYTPKTIDDIHKSDYLKQNHISSNRNISRNRVDQNHHVGFTNRVNAQQSLNETPVNQYLFSTIQQQRNQPSSYLQRLENSFSLTNSFAELVHREVSKQRDSFLQDYIPNFRTLKFKELYKATIDGFTQQALNHSLKWHNKGRIVVFIQSQQGQVFGGYLSQPWPKGIGKYKDDKAFIFNLTQRSFFPQIKNVSQLNFDNEALTSNYAFEHNLFQLFSFGDDIRIFENCDSQMTSYCNLGHTYAFLNIASSERRMYLAGGEKFKVKEIQIYSLVSQFD